MHAKPFTGYNIAECSEWKLLPSNTQTYHYIFRKAMRAYEESWDRRLGLMCCCVDRKGRNQVCMNSFSLDCTYSF